MTSCEKFVYDPEKVLYFRDDLDFFVNFKSLFKMYLLTSWLHFFVVGRSACRHGIGVICFNKEIKKNH